MSEATWNSPTVATEKSAVEEVDTVDQDWLYSGPGVVPPDPPGAYLPRNRGGRRSAKAAWPSRKSALR